ncbi:unnamed protein product [Cuscuta campestris]|uniref:Pentacotripeptide-repeat region of PRORP domain-containing protein n=1 Tax=Cuscuta campestris TaxID=132261 RepID=A0A484KX11_9ASTE|nr:unnamed protein product [Cuscuta campestris]
MRAASKFLQNVSFSVLRHTRRHSAGGGFGGLFCAASPLSRSSAASPSLLFHPRCQVYFSTCPVSASTFVEQLVCESEDPFDHEEELCRSDPSWGKFHFDSSFESTELEGFDWPAVDAKKLEDSPGQWHPSRLNWLYKELHGKKHDSLIRILNAQRGWLTQEYATYVVHRLLQIRAVHTAFMVYKWMMMQSWYQFDLNLATRVADCLGKECQIRKCREVYDDILNQGRVPDESTFHILTALYLSSSCGYLEEAFDIYRRMIQLGGYKPHLSLHNSLFEALVETKRHFCAENLERAEFVYKNMQAFGLQIHKDIFGGLIWLHSYQDSIDKDRIASLREEMCSRGIEEGTDVLESVLRACSKNGDVDEAEKTWTKLLSFSNSSPSPQACLYRMLTYAKIGEHMKALEILRGMQEDMCSIRTIAYRKIIEILSKAQKQELAESVMKDFINRGLGPLMPSFIHMMAMYLVSGSHEKLESTFFQSLKQCRTNQTVFSLYLQSLVEKGDIKKAGEVFDEMAENPLIGVNARCCNNILRGYLSHGEHKKAEKVIEMMRLKKFNTDSF